MHFDLKTDSFHCDGLPRLTFQRPDGTFPHAPADPSEARPESASTETHEFSTNDLHLRSPTTARNHRPNVGEDDGFQILQLCRCINQWLPAELFDNHACTVPILEGRTQARRVTYRQVRSRQWIPWRGDQRDPDGDLTKRGRQYTTTNGVGPATGAGGEIDDSIRVRDFAKSCGSQRAQAFMGTIVRDFARNRGNILKVLLPLR